jgi:hypothetical protein
MKAEDMYQAEMEMEATIALAAGPGRTWGERDT